MKRIAAALVLCPLFAAAQVDDSIVITQQGRLVDGADQPVNATVTLGFSIYASHDTQVDTTPLWSESYEVLVDRGTYGIVLGDTLGANSAKKPLPAAVFEKEGRYIAVKVNGGGDLLPRLRIGTTAHAVHARSALIADLARKVGPDGVDTAALGDGSVTLAKLARTSGKVVGLDADTLDGLDSAQFAPAAIESKIDTITTDVAAIRTAVGTDLVGAVSTIQGNLGVNVGTRVDAISTKVDGLPSAISAIGAKVDDVQTSVGAALGTGVTTLTTRLGDPGGTSLAAQVAALTTEVAALKAATPAVSGTKANPAENCYALKLAQPSAPTARYWINPGGSPPFEVQCEMVVEGGGWTRWLSLTTNAEFKPIYGLPNGHEYVINNTWTWTKTLLKNSNREVLVLESVAPGRYHLHDFKQGSNVFGEDFVGVLTGDVPASFATRDFVGNSWVQITAASCNANNHAQWACTPPSGVRFHYGTRNWSNNGGSDNGTDWWFTGYNAGYGDNSRLVKNWNGQYDITPHAFYVR